jgi:hypothetical protein
MAGHGVGLQQRHAVHYVLAASGIRAKRTLPGVTAIEKKNLVVAALRANTLDRGCKPVEPADTTV